MITPELIGYIKGEFAKGRTREEIRTTLVTGGGWSEADIGEAFKTLIPMQQGFISPQNNSGNMVITGNISKKSGSFWPNFIFVIIGIVCVVSWYFYHPQITSFWNSTMDKLPDFSMPSFNFDKITGLFGGSKDEVVAPPTNPVVKPVVDIIKDCGIGTAPNLKEPLTYQNDPVLTCLGDSALRCESAKAILQDVYFPTIFQITQSQNAGQDICSFKLSYGADSTLTDATGKKLAGQYIACPIDIVKAIDETKTPSLFSIPSISNPSRYASQVYFYGTLGLFIENNMDKDRIQALGCSGDYISSIVASYNKTQ